MSFSPGDEHIFQTTLERRIEILAAFSEAFMDSENPRIEGFFASNDLGMCFAYGVWRGLCLLTDSGSYYVNETWWELCMLLGVEPDPDYVDLAHFLKTSWL